MPLVLATTWALAHGLERGGSRIIGRHRLMGRRSDLDGNGGLGVSVLGRIVGASAAAETAIRTAKARVPAARRTRRGLETGEFGIMAGGLGD